MSIAEMPSYLSKKIKKDDEPFLKENDYKFVLYVEKLDELWVVTPKFQKKINDL